LLRWGRSVLISVQFLTRLPVKIKDEVKAGELAGAAAVFPLTGLLIGAALLLIYYLSRVIWSHEVAVLLALAGLIGLTGGLHLDGLMDTADGIMSGKSRDKMLEIMKDSRVGAMGVIACFVVLAFKLVALILLEPAHVCRVLIVFTVIGRCSMVWALACFPYARSGPGTGRPFAENVTAKHAILATVIALTVVCGIAGVTGLALIGAGVFCGLAVAWYLNRRLNGLTGDTYGAINEVAETAVVLAALALAEHGWLSWLL